MSRSTEQFAPRRSALAGAGGVAAIVASMLLAAVTGMRAQADSTATPPVPTDSLTASNRGFRLGALAGLGMSIGTAPAASGTLIPGGLTRDMSTIAHISCSIVGDFGLDAGVQVGVPDYDGINAEAYAASTYPEYFLLSNGVAAFTTQDVWIGPVYRFHSGPLSVEPALLATLSTLLTHDQTLYLKRRGTNEYRSIVERTPNVDVFTVVPALSVGYRLLSGHELGLQFRIAYAATNFALASETTDRTLAGDDHTTISNTTFTRRLFVVALGFYTVLGDGPE